MIDCGIDELFMDEESGNIVIYAPFEAYGDIQKYIEENHFELVSARFDRIPTDTKDLSEAEQEDVQKLVDKLEEDDDVQNVYTNMK